MQKQRIIETNEGIQGEVTVEVFDQFARRMRDKGWNNIEEFISAGITSGNVLEIGPGPGYVGLEWLKRCPDARLTGCEISRNMIRMAERNAASYGLQEKTVYTEGNCMEMPFEDGSFDAVFSNGSLHEWEDPVRVFSEIDRVLTKGGRFCVADMRRDVSPLLSGIIYRTTKPKEIRPGFLSSLNASYTAEEILSILKQSKLCGAVVKKTFFGLLILGRK